MQQLEQASAEFIWSTSLSASIACSNQFKQFLCNITQISIDFFLKKQQISYNPRSIIQNFSKNEIKDSILMAGNKAFNEMIKKLCNFRFVNLMIDAGTVINMRVVHSTLSNPYSGMAPLPFRTVQKKETIGNATIINWK